MSVSSTSWKTIQHTASPRRRRDSATWRRCRRWARLQVLAAMMVLLLLQVPSLELAPGLQDNQCRWARFKNMDLILFHLQVIDSCESPQAAWTSHRHEGEQAQHLWLEYLLRAPLPQSAALQCSKIRQVGVISQATSPITRTTLPRSRTWDRAPTSTKSNRFWREASTPAFRLTNFTDLLCIWASLFCFA